MGKVARRIFVCWSTFGTAPSGMTIFVFLFMFVWFSGWNGFCSFLVFKGIRAAIQEPTCFNYAKMVCMFFIPHVLVGLLMPLFFMSMFGPLSLVFYWPYFVQLFMLF